MEFQYYNKKSMFGDHAAILHTQKLVSAERGRLPIRLYNVGMIV